MQKHVNPGALIAAVRRRIKQAVQARVADLELTAPQFWMLINVHEHPGVAQIELVGRVPSDQPTASRILRNLVDRGFIRAEPDPDDGRRTSLHLTAAGEKLARRLLPVAREVRATVVKGMTAAEVDELSAALHKIIDNLDAAARHRTSRGNT